MNFDERVKLCAFDGKTTYLNDFRIPPIEPHKKYRWESEEVERGVLPPPKHHSFRCPETLTIFRDSEYIPANFTWERRPILHPPLQSSQYCGTKSLNEDKGRQNAIKTRPRVYFGCAVSIDDVPDEETRNMLLNYMYKTDFKRTFKETQDYVRSVAKQNKPAATDCKNVPEVIFPCPVENYSVMKKITLPTPKVDENLKKHAESWDKKQKRALFDPTQTFWEKFYEKRKDHNIDPSPSSLVPDETIDYLTKLIDADKLRFPHDKLMGSYDGHVPTTTVVGVKKVEFSNKHPMKTTNQTVFVNHFDHSINHYEK